MKNKVGDLRNHLFNALERLNDDELSEDQLKLEISRAQAIADVGKVLVDSAKTAVMFAKVTGRTKELEKDEFIDESRQLDRPKAEYSNKGQCEQHEKTSLMYHQFNKKQYRTKGKYNNHHQTVQWKEL
jgi:hypothetical protein